MGQLTFAFQPRQETPSVTIHNCYRLLAIKLYCQCRRKPQRLLKLTFAGQNAAQLSKELEKPFGKQKEKKKSHSEKTIKNTLEGSF